jgi:hypothetical protein
MHIGRGPKPRTQPDFEQSSQLNATGLRYVDNAHARAFQMIGPLVDPKTYRWLKAATQPV